MSNLYIFQMIGVFLTVSGLAGLTASAYAYGRPLTPDEKWRMSGEQKHMRRLPINLETVASAAFVLIGIGVLNWSKFNLCAYLAYWLPSLSDSLRFWLSCP